MLQRLRCWFGKHEWTRIGSAPSTITEYDTFHKVWDRNNDGILNYRPAENTVAGFVLLVECMWCPAEQGYGEYAGTKNKRSAAYARSFIEQSPEGTLRKADA